MGFIKTPMLASIKNQLSQVSPYPAWDRKSLLLVLTLFLLTFLFTYFLEPFQVYPPEHIFSYFGICLFRALLLACLAIIYFPLLSLRKNWTLGHKLWHIPLFLLLVGVVNFLIRDIIYDNPNNWSFNFFWIEIRNTFLVGMFFLWILIPFDFQRLLEKTRSVSILIPPNQEVILQKKDILVSIQTQVKADDFQLAIHEFVFARTEGNYTEIYTVDTTGLRKFLKRISLKSLEQQLSSYRWITKTHRAYLVNLQMIEGITGNAQGYQLSISHYNEKIPVSRAFVPSFKKTRDIY
jgi:hypothetical protein